MALHGLTVTPTDMRQCRTLLVNHLISGACTEHNVHAHVPGTPSRTACWHIAASSLSAVEIASAIIQELISIKSKEFPTDHLEFVASCMDITVPHRDSNCRRHLRILLGAPLGEFHFDRQSHRLRCA